MKKLVCIALLVSGCAGWKKRDVALGAVYLAASTIDMMQTSKIAHDCREMNPIIGECGERVSPQVWFFATDYLGYVLLSMYGGDHKTWILGLADGMEIKTVQRNWLDYPQVSPW